MPSIIRPVANRIEHVLSRLALLSFDASLSTFELDVAGTPATRTISDASALQPLAARSAFAPRLTDDSASAVAAGSVSRVAARAALPIVFIHRSNSEYLKYSLGQAKRSNPDSTVYLIGDDANNAHDCVEHRQLTDYSQESNYFKRLYRHYSTQNVAYELFCFERWFILRDFLHANDLQECLYLDSDTMLYADVTTDAAKFKQFDFTLCWNTVGCVFFVTRRDGLDEFCRFILDIYSRKDQYHYDKMVSHYAVRRRNGLAGGACDMTAFQLYSEANFGRVGEASHVIDGSVYDPNINLPHPGLEMDGTVKKVFWKNGQPYGRHLRTGEEVRFNSLHFQGAEVKKVMARYCSDEHD